MFKFEKLDVWNDSIQFSDSVYRLARSFPSDERFGLTQQMRRSAVSIAANIAEGSSRSSSTDFARFVEIAYGSLMETVSHAAIAQRQNFLLEEDYRDLIRSCGETRPHVDRSQENAQTAVTASVP
ncbi:MAG: four helix bundle protein [Planctomycetaceae bacterium]|nr:four helix bundle protein [Planctomycetaceae bacterium]